MGIGQVAREGRRHRVMPDARVNQVNEDGTVESV